MSRPVDWRPLEAADPVPGDPDELERIAKRYSDLADELLQQADNLKKIATTDGWDAEAGRAFATSAEDLSGKLHRANGRYAAAAGAIRAWAPQLRHAQAVADDALVKAKDAQTDIDANQPPEAAAAGPPTPEQTAAERRRADAYDDGVGALQAARRQLQDAVSHRDEHASRAAKAVRQVIEEDGLKDSRWDRFKNWVHEHAKDIKAIADIAGWLATALGVLAIVFSFIPVLNFLTPILLLAAATLTLVALICHMLLALSGDGSWLDVGIDLFALVTFGYGRSLSAGLKGASAATRMAGARAARKGAEKAARAAVRNRTAATRVAGRRAASKAAKRAAGARLQATKAAARRKGRQAAQAVTSVKPATSLKAGLRYLGGDVGGIVDDANRIAAQTGNAAKVAARADEVGQIAKRAAVVTGTGVAVDFADKSTTFEVPFTDVEVDLTGPLPAKPGFFDQVKPFFTRESGSNL